MAEDAGSRSGWKREEIRAAGAGLGDRRGAAGWRAVGAAVAAGLAWPAAWPGLPRAGRRPGPGWMSSSYVRPSPLGITSAGDRLQMSDASFGAGLLGSAG